ncbi:M16 family metallopeptidase [Inediibacterium massiliense]|uniref:M16 family metallopeptidase n=1 Tax=Inediibacterium massiliense TaxID=1658111 RepID=UPI0006B4D65F|nr:pitrilysin family protein [Inediibacterium massiliense]
MTNKIFNSQEFKLKNGIELVTVKKDTQLFSIHIGLRVGPIYEKESERGICHFIEHMLFKGTHKRDNHKINQDFEERAGSYDAYTDYTSTVFSIHALKEEFEISIDLLSDMIMHSTFPKDEIEKEKKVILSELKTDLDDVEEFSFIKAHDLAFCKSPLKHSILGKQKTVKAFTKEDLVDFYHKNYIPNQCVISVVSPYEHDQVQNIIEKYFGDWNKKEEQARFVCVEKNRNIEKITYKKNIEQSTILFLYTFHGLTRKEELALEILNYKLGESANSILFRELREERGFAYDVYSEADPTKFIKTLVLYTSTSKEHIDEAKEVINNCIQKIVHKEISFDDKNILHMKKVLKTGIASILEDSQGLGNYILHQKLMSKKIDAFMEDLKDLEDINEEDIYKVAQKILNEPTIHILLNEENE